MMCTYLWILIYNAKWLLCLVEAPSKFVTLLLHGVLLLDWQSGCSKFSLAKEVEGGYSITTFKSGGNTAYALGWKTSIRIDIPSMELRKWREIGAKDRIKDTVRVTKNSWSFIIALNFYYIVTSIWRKHLTESYLLFPPQHIKCSNMKRYLNANYC